MQLVDRIVAPFRGAEAALPRSVVAAAPALLTVALVIVLAAQLASLLWRVMGSTGAETMPTPAVDAGAVPAVDLGSIVNAHLFGVANLSGDPNAAPATSANLALAGTLAGLDPEQGWAIIGANAQAARVYATGATLPGGTRLFAVYPDRVILDRNGTRESLALPRFSGGAGATPVAYQPDGSVFCEHGLFFDQYQCGHSFRILLLRGYHLDRPHERDMQRLRRWHHHYQRYWHGADRLFYQRRHHLQPDGEFHQPDTWHLQY